MAPRRWWQSSFLLTSLTLLVLGVGNATVGTQKLAQYQAVVAEGRARGYFPDAGPNNRLFPPLDDEGERYQIGRAKVDLYHVVLSGGLWMSAVGLILTIIAVVRLRIRNEEAIGARPISATGLPKARAR